MKTEDILNRMKFLNLRLTRINDAIFSLDDKEMTTEVSQGKYEYFKFPISRDVIINALYQQKKLDIDEYNELLSQLGKETY